MPCTSLQTAELLCRCLTCLLRCQCGHRCLNARFGACSQAEMMQLVGNLMRQLECLLHEYLSFNWDHASAVLRSNQDVLQ